MRRRRKLTLMRGALSDTDIHYLAGYLYVASGENLVSVTLGEKIYDASADEERDVDIAVISAGTIGVLAAEVKDHARSLDVTVVEQLCQKLRDMPSVTRRAIVSSSGFTAPALRKAASHDVQCLRLVEGPIPQLAYGIDLSQLTELTVGNTGWREDPHVTVGPTVVLTPEEKRAVGPNTRVRLFDGSHITLKELCDRIARQFDPGAVEFDDADRISIDDTRPLDHPVRLEVGARSVEALDARIVGVVHRTTSILPLHAAYYLADDSGIPFAAAALFELDRALFAVTVGGDGNTLRLFQIPADVRVGRPLRCRIFESTA